MYAINNDFFDGFSVMFGEKWSILNGQSYPLGYYAASYLDLDKSLLGQLNTSVRELEEEFQAYLSSRSSTSAALAQQALNNTWKLLFQLPVYCEIGSAESAGHLFEYFREHSAEVDDMVTQGTEKNQMLRNWLERLHNLTHSIDRFVFRAQILLDEYYKALPERSASAYAKIYGRYSFDNRSAIDVMEQEVTIDELPDDEQMEYKRKALEDIERRTIPHPLSVEVTYTTAPHPTREGEFILAEQMEFIDLESFLYMDLLKGITAGHIPRRCGNCGRFFLLDSGYDIRYCTNIAPGEDTKTCRQVGAHIKEKMLNGTVQVRAEYKRVYERLKARKRYGTILVDEWNAAVAKAQEIKAQAENGKLSEPEWKAKFDRM